MKGPKQRTFKWKVGAAEDAGPKRRVLLLLTSDDRELPLEMDADEARKLGAMLVSAADMERPSDDVSDDA